VPGFLALASRLKTEKKIDLIACVSVNDAFVMEEWRKSQNVNDEILMLSDGSGKLAKGGKKEN
jgi:peroxiredoxin